MLKRNGLKTIFIALNIAVLSISVSGCKTKTPGQTASSYGSYIYEQKEYSSVTTSLNMRDSDLSAFFSANPEKCIYLKNRENAAPELVSKDIKTRQETVLADSSEDLHIISADMNDTGLIASITYSYDDPGCEKALFLHVSNDEFYTKTTINLTDHFDGEQVSTVKITEKDIFVFSDKKFLKMDFSGNLLGRYIYKSDEDRLRYVVKGDDIIMYSENRIKIIDRDSFAEKSSFSISEKRIWAGGEKNLYYYTGDGLVMVDPGPDPDRFVFSFSDTGIDRSSVVYFRDYDADRFLFIITTDEGLELVNVSTDKEAQNQTADDPRIDLTLICVNRSMFQGTVNKFNNTYSDYNVNILPEIKLERYAIESLDQNYDLLEIPGMSFYEDMIRSGYLHEIDEYLDNSTTINKSDFFSRIYEDLSVNGNIYAIPRQMYLTDLWGPEDVFVDLQNWDIHEFLNFMKMYPDALSESNYPDIADIKSRILYVALLGTVDDLIVSDKTIDTESLAFILEEINCLDIKENSMKMEERLRNGDVVLLKSDIHSADELADEQSKYERKLVPLGFPSLKKENSGGLIEYFNMIGISSESNDPIGAWSFLEFYLNQNFSQKSKDVPTRIGDYNIRMSRSTFDEEITLNGIRYYPVSQSEIDKITKAYENAKKYTALNRNIIAVIDEETAYYFRNEKELDETIEIIESRVNIMLNESQ